MITHILRQVFPEIDRLGKIFFFNISLVQIFDLHFTLNMLSGISRNG